MIEPKQFCETLGNYNIEFYCGVPDSLLKNLCAFIDDTLPQQQHIITANEGNAIAMAAGHYLGSQSCAMVYMQNSGLGNAINPLTSLADPKVYSIPMLIVIGWRGEPGVKDEPQHVMQGQVTEQQLTLLNIPYVVIDAESSLDELLPPLLSTMVEASTPVAVLVRKGTFAKYQSKQTHNAISSLTRERALQLILEGIDERDIVVSTTGKTSREVFEIRQSLHQPANDFLTVGGMGHTSSIAMGVALTQPDRRVFAIDGDGSMLMHMGALPIIGCHASSNLIHILLNNQSHESVGGQPTVAGSIDMQQIALASGYKHYACAGDDVTLSKCLTAAVEHAGPVMLEVKIAIGSRDDLGRPTSTPIENKHAFMQHVSSAQ